MATLTKSVSVSASIPGSIVTIFGYTSPESRVELSSPKAFAVTYSQKNGYFIFDRVILPRNPQELCLISIDDSNRLNNPVCFPEPPENNLTNIGPVLLSPTISLDLDNNFASGQSIPNSFIKLHFYKQNRPQLIKQAQALSLPILETKTDSRGNYSVNLTGNSESAFRIYSTSVYLDNNSPKSNTLLYGQTSIFWVVIFSICLIFSLFLLLFFRKRKRIRFLPAIIYNVSITPWIKR